MITKHIAFPKLRGFLSLLLLVNVLFAGGRSQAGLEWPEITRESKPWTRWWWMGSIVNEADLTAEMEKYARAGLGGLEITPIYGVKGYEGRFIEYLSPRWMRMLLHTLKEGDRLDIGIDMATGTGWPFGGPWVGAEHACKNVAHRTYRLKGGESLSEPISHVQRPMVRAIGRRIAISDLEQPIAANEDLQALALEQVRFEKPLPLQALMAYSDQGETLNSTKKVDASGKLDWVAPPGKWTLYAVFQGWHGKMVERAGPGGEGNVIDHFSAEAIRDYLGKFDRAFADFNVSSLRAYFNDSYEVDDAAGESNWTPDFFEEFKMRRGYDLRNHLPALFGSDSAEKNIRVLCDYRETVSDLLLEKFTIPWREWAAGKGALIRNQAHGSPANILDLYAVSSIPETEGSDILKFKFASSAAHVMGKRLASAECATWLDEHFLATLADVKGTVDRFFLGGVNHICYHGTTFSPPDEDWPGWLFYASVHFGPTNSFWNHFKALNTYVARCQSFLQAGRPDNDVLLYFPIFDRWSQAGRSMLQHFGGGAGGTAARTVGQSMLAGGYTFDFISDRQLEDVEVIGNSLRSGGVPYETVVLPQCHFIPVSTLAKLVELARSGATVIVHNGLPSDVPGWGNLDARREKLRDLISRMSFSRTENTDVEVARLGDGMFLLGDDLPELLNFAGVQREPLVDRGLRFVRRSHQNGQYYFIVNDADDAVDDWIPLPTGAKSIAIFDPMFGKNGLAGHRISENGMREVYLQLVPGESCILMTSATVLRARPYTYLKAAGEPQEITGTWCITFVRGGPDLPSSIETKRLESWTSFGGEAVKVFSGTARYTVSFAKPEREADGWLLDLGHVRESARIRLNGEDLGTLVGPPYRIPIAANVLKEENLLEIEVSNLMANRIADLDRRQVNWKKFYNVNFPARRRENRGEDGLFSAAHWLPRQSGLIGPVNLLPVEFMMFER